MPVEVIEHIQVLRDLKLKLATVFREPIDTADAGTKLDLVSRGGNKLREFKHLHQSCTMAAWDFRVAMQIRTLLNIDGYLALYDANSALHLYSVARAVMELHGLMLNVLGRLEGYVNGDTRDWRSRGEGFFGSLIRARWASRDKEIVEKLVALGVSKNVLSPIHSKDCEAALFEKPQYKDDKARYEKFCDYVHANVQGYYLGSPGFLMSDRATMPGVYVAKLPQVGPVNRYQYPATSKFEEAVDDTARIVAVHARGILDTCDRTPLTPYSPDEVRTHTGTDHGFKAVISSKQNSADTPSSHGVKVGRNDPCPCGSGKKFKHCHMN